MLAVDRRRRCGEPAPCQVRSHEPAASGVADPIRVDVGSEDLQRTGAAQRGETQGVGRLLGVQSQHGRAARCGPDGPGSHGGIEAAFIVRRHQHRRNSQFDFDTEGEGGESCG